MPALHSENAAGGCQPRAGPKDARRVAIAERMTMKMERAVSSDNGPGSDVKNRK